MVENLSPTNDVLRELTVTLTSGERMAGDLGGQLPCELEPHLPRAFGGDLRGGPKVARGAGVSGEIIMAFSRASEQRRPFSFTCEP